MYRLLSFIKSLFLAWIIWANVAQAEIRIGVIAPLSGPVSEYGTALVNGLELAKERSPAAFSHIKYVIEDAQNDPHQAVRAFQKLVNQDKVHLIYVWGIQFCVVVSPLADKYKVPVIAQCANRDVARNREFVLRFMNSASDYTAKVLAHARGEGWRNLGILIADQPYLEDMATSLEIQFKSERALINERVPINQMDFRTIILRLKQAKLDAVGVFLGPGQVSQFYKQAQELGYSPNTFGTNYFESQSEIDLSSGSMNGAIFANHYVNPEFSRTYRTKFGNESQITWAALGFEFANVLADILPFNRKRHPSIKSFENISRTGWATGFFEYRHTADQGPYFEFPLVIKAIDKGKIIVSSISD